MILIILKIKARLELKRFEKNNPLRIFTRDHSSVHVQDSTGQYRTVHDSTRQYTTGVAFTYRTWATFTVLNLSNNDAIKEYFCICLFS